MTKRLVKGKVTIGKPSSTISSKNLYFYASQDTTSMTLNLVEYNWQSSKLSTRVIGDTYQYPQLNEKWVIEPERDDAPYAIYYPTVHDSFYALLGDMNSDKVIDMVDMAIQANQYNVTPNNKDFNSLLDLNNDRIIDIYDIVALGRKL